MRCIGLLVQSWGMETKKHERAEIGTHMHKGPYWCPRYQWHLWKPDVEHGWVLKNPPKKASVVEESEEDQEDKSGDQLGAGDTSPVQASKRKR